MEGVSLVGWSHTKFGKLADDDIESLIVRAATDAVRDAGVEFRDIDSIHVGLFNNGFSPQDFPASLVLQASPALRFKPATRVENACATGSAAVHAGARNIQAGRARLALVVGVEKMTSTPGAEIGECLMHASYRKEAAQTAPSVVGVFGDIARNYFERYGGGPDTLARIAVKNHRNGVDNPYAQMRTALDFDFCNEVSAGNPMVAAPLRRTDCSPVSDGASAVVLADADTAGSMDKAVDIAALVQVNDFLPIRVRDLTRLEGAAVAWERALHAAGIGLLDLDFVETHDCFTIAELMEYEAMGLTPIGQGRRAIDEGWVERDGKLPVNRSGGLKAKGHPIGATGVSMHAIAAMQLTDSAGAMQIPNAERGGIFNMGGVGVANFVSILQRRR